MILSYLSSNSGLNYFFFSTKLLFIDNVGFMLLSMGYHTFLLFF